MWTESVRKYFFESSDELSGPDELFLKRYCSNTTTERIDLHKINTGDLRMILNRIACIAPNLDHSSPQWSSDPKRRLLVCMGRAAIVRRKTNRGTEGTPDMVRVTPVIRKPRFGLCAVDGKIYILADQSWLNEQDNRQPRYDGFSAAQWQPFPDRNDYKIWRNALNSQDLDTTLGERTPLSSFIKRVADDAAPTVAEVDGEFAGVRQDQGIPEFIHVVYPGLSQEMRINPETGTQTKNAESSAKDSQPTMQLNTILYGPPGTGKTLATLGIALSLFETLDDTTEVIRFASQTLTEAYAPPPLEEWANWVTRYDQLVTEGRIAFTTFHQNYAYEDFVEGIRAETRADGENGPTSVSYSVQDGIFKSIAYRALYSWLTGEPYPVGSTTSEAAARETVEVWLQSGKFPSNAQAQANDDDAQPYLLIIDEINRGNMARILGELITLLEDSKRARREPVPGQQPLKAILPYTRKPFIVPPNLYILGTMNTADRSLIGLDVALRRRFSFVELPPRPEALPEDVEGVRLRAFLEELNRRIAEVLDSDHLIGHAFLAGVTTLQGLGDAMRQKVIPQLREYFHDRPQDLFEVLKTADGATCEFLIFEGSGRNQKLKGVRAENLYIASTYNRLLRNDPAANAANQGG